MNGQPLGSMDSQQIAAIVNDALESFEHDPSSSTIGTPWSAERVDEAIAELRACLVSPSLRDVRRRPPEVESEAIQSLWVVAASSDGYAVFFDPQSREYGLATEAASGLLESINVGGDLVGTFCAR